MRGKKSFAVPLLLTGFCFVSAYLYLIIVGENISVWVYDFIGLMVAYGVYTGMKKIKDKTKTTPGNKAKNNERKKQHNESEGYFI